MCTADAAKFCAESPARRCAPVFPEQSKVSQTCQTALYAVAGRGFDVSHTPPCARSVICAAKPANNPDGLHGGVDVVNRVEWKYPPNMGYKAVYPMNCLPAAAAAAVSMDSGAIFGCSSVFRPACQLFKFSRDQVLWRWATRSWARTRTAHGTGRYRGQCVDL
jgi:hypothetical protein